MSLNGERYQKTAGDARHAGAGCGQAYTQLRNLDAQLEITRSTIKARQDSLQLTQSLEKYGAGSLAGARQACGAGGGLAGAAVCRAGRGLAIAAADYYF
jgi:hypothetical protein